MAFYAVARLSSCTRDAVHACSVGLVGDELRIGSTRSYERQLPHGEQRPRQRVGFGTGDVGTYVAGDAGYVRWVR